MYEKTVRLCSSEKTALFRNEENFERSTFSSVKVCLSVCFREDFSTFLLCALSFSSEKTLLLFFFDLLLSSVINKKAALASQKKAKKKQENYSSLFFHLLFVLLFFREETLCSEAVFERVSRRCCGCEHSLCSSFSTRATNNSCVQSFLQQKEKSFFFPNIFSFSSQKWVVCMYKTCALFCGEFRA